MTLELDQLNAATLDYWKNKSVDIFFRENIILYRLLGNGSMELNLVDGNDLVDGGLKIRQFLEYGRSNVSSYGNKSTIDTSIKEIINAARFAWSGYVGSNTIDLDEQTANAGAAQMIALVMSKMKNVEKSIRDKMGSDIYLKRTADTDGYAFDGLADLFNASTTTAYGSIQEGDMSQWAANLDTDSEVISYKVMQKLFRAGSIGQSKSAKPNLVVTTQVLKDGYTRTLQAQQRFQDSVTAEAGFQNILHDGVPMVYDDNQASGIVDCLNLEYLGIKTHNKYNFTRPVWAADHKEPDTMTCNVRWRGALCCSNRKAHSRGSGKTEPA